jgi:AcrR family transcriptional regulator
MYGEGVAQVLDRRTRNDYFAAAMAILADDGVAGLTTTRLCDRLEVTRGSLYHHFESGPAFHDALIDHWEHELVPAALAAIDAVEPRARIDLLQHLALHADHDAEKAIRAWAHTNPTVAAALARVDAAREDSLARAFVDVGIQPALARTLSRIGFSLLVGAQQLDDAIDRERLAAVLAEYRDWIDHRRADR